MIICILFGIYINSSQEGKQKIKYGYNLYTYLMKTQLAYAKYIIICSKIYILYFINFILMIILYIYQLISMIMSKWYDYKYLR